MVDIRRRNIGERQIQARPRGHRIKRGVEIETAESKVEEVNRLGAVARLLECHHVD